MIMISLKFWPIFKIFNTFILILIIIEVNYIFGFGLESTPSHHLMSEFIRQPLMDIKDITSLYQINNISETTDEEFVSFIDIDGNSTTILMKSFEEKSQSLGKPMSQLHNDWSLISQQIIMLLVVKILLL